MKRDMTSLNLKEVGGGENVRPYWEHYIDKSDGLIWVVDASDQARVEDSKKELHKLLQD